MLATLNVSLGGSKNKIDLGNPARWGLADLKLFGHILLQYENELELLSTNREKENQVIGEIKSNILKGRLSFFRGCPSHGICSSQLEQGAKRSHDLTEPKMIRNLRRY